MKDAGILLYNLGNKKGEQISGLCSNLDIKIRWVKPEEFYLPLAGLTDFSGKDTKILNVQNNTNILNTPLAKRDYENGTKESFSGEMFVMVNFSEELLDRFLREYKLKQIEPVFLKAILTPHNKTWNSLMLNQELIRERLEMSRLNNKK